MQVRRINGEDYVELNAVGEYADQVEGMFRPNEKSGRQWIPLALVIDAVRDAASAATQANDTRRARRAYEMLEQLEDVSTIRPMSV
jgi:hypothetical protein